MLTLERVAFSFILDAFNDRFEGRMIDFPRDSRPERGDVAKRSSEEGKEILVAKSCAN